jgi:Peptidase propeptide and YPEB domain
MSNIATLAFAFILTAVSATYALADKPGPDWLPAEQVILKLKAAGYSEISKIEADDGRWEGEGMKAGKKMDFHADPRTGVITSEKPDD